jgi:hypothetical protein
MDKRILTIAIVLIILALIVAPVASAKTVNQLLAPKPVAPKNNENLGDYSSSQPVLLQWKPVNDESLSGYLVEAEYYEPSYEGWYRFNSIPRITADTFYSLYFPPGEVGDYIGRWRVTALSNLPEGNSKPSAWQTFTYEDTTWADVRFPTLHVITPLNNAKFSQGAPQNYEWSLIPDAAYYYLHHQKLNAENEWKFAGPTVIFGPNPTFPFNTVCSDGAYCWSQPGNYRWRVVADGKTYGSFMKISNWRYFTVT